MKTQTRRFVPMTDLPEFTNRGGMIVRCWDCDMTLRAHRALVRDPDGAGHVVCRKDAALDGFTPKEEN